MCNGILPHHSHPAQSRNTLTNSRQVIEEAAASVSFSEVLDLLDVIRNWLQQVLKLCLWEMKGGVRTGQQRDAGMDVERKQCHGERRMKED